MAKIDNIKIYSYPFNEILERSIENFVEDICNGSVFHTIKWNKIISQIFQTELLYFICYDKEIKAVMPVHFIKKSIFRNDAFSSPTHLEVPYGGPIFEPNLTSIEKNKVIENLIDKILSYKKGVHLSITSQPNTIIENQRYCLNINALETAALDLSPSIEEIWKSINPKRRNMIKKAENNKIRILNGAGELISIYYEMIKELSYKTGIIQKPIEYYKRIVDELNKTGDARVFLALYNEKYLSGGIFLKSQSIGYYWHGASINSSPNLGQNEALQWEVIKWLKKENCNMYDLVRIDKERLPGVALFKMGFSDRVYTFQNNTYRTPTGSIYRRISYLMNPIALYQKFNKNKHAKNNSSKYNYSF